MTWTMEDAEKAADQARKQVADAKKARRRAVRIAVQTGGTVPYDLRTLLEDGHSLATVRKVLRRS